jgi:hypothetical protein
VNAKMSLGWGLLGALAWLGAAPDAVGQEGDVSSCVQSASGSAASAEPAGGGDGAAKASEEDERSDGRPLTAEELQRRLGLTLEQATRLASALALGEAPTDIESADDESSHQAAIQQIESEFIALLNEAPDNVGLAEQVRSFYSWSSAEAIGTEVLDLIARARDPAALAIRLAGRSDATPHGRSCEFLLAALAVRPEAAELWAYASMATRRQDWKVALFEQSFRSLVSPGTALSCAKLAAATAVAEGWLRAEIDAGLASRATADFHRLPPSVRALVEDGRTGVIPVRGSIFEFAVELRDLRLDLAMAAVLAGDLPTARSLLARLDASRAAARPPGPEAAPNPSLRRRLLDVWLKPSADDPFGLFIAALAPPDEEGTSLAWQLTLAQAARREGYPEIAAFVLDAAARKLAELSALDAPTPTGRGAPPTVLSAVRDLAAELASLRQTVETDALAARAAMRNALGPDPAAAVIARWLQTPPRVPFAARPLPPGIAPLDLPEAAGAAASAELEERMHLPAGFTPLRAERQGANVAVFALSTAYDADIGISAGGYWVLLSADGGSTWRRPLYTGLRANLPYTVRSLSALPLMAGSHLQVEVEVLAIEEPHSGRTPTPDTAPRQAQQGIYLDLPLAELERDTDGDGLTDLAEERLLTDPRNRDTNGDGLGDGEDPTPMIPHGDAAAPTAQVAAILLAERLPEEASPCSERTVFAIGERPWFAGIQPGYRLIVLTWEEAATLSDSVVVPFSLMIELLVFDRSGRRGLAITNDGHKGQQGFEEKDGRWQMADLAACRR